MQRRLSLAMDHDDGDDDTIVVGQRSQPDTRLQQTQDPRPTLTQRGSQTTIPSIDNASALHACVECDARFTRRDHLKRHINSLHTEGGTKLHTCQLCGKSFARRDVLHRHHHSCSTAKNSSTVVEPSAKRVRLSCQRCNELQVRCSGSAPCDNCLRFGHACANIDRSQRSTVAGTTTLPSPADSAQFQRIPSPDPHHELDHRSIDDLQQDNDLNFETLDLPLRNDSIVEEVVQGSSVSGRSKRPANKRGRYVSKACINCQKRKVKCSGHSICLQCSAADIQCAYNQGRRRQKPKPDQVSSIRAEVGKVVTSASDVSPDQSSWMQSLMQIMSRISSLERNQTLLTNKLVDEGIDDESRSGSDSSQDDEDEPLAVPRMEWNDAVHGGTSLLDAIDTLTRTVASGERPLPDSRDEREEPNTQTPTTWQSFPRFDERNIKTITRETRLNNVSDLRNSVEIYFSSMHPLYPYLNEASFRADLETFLATGTDDIHTADGYQFVALVNLIHATTLVLNNDCSDSKRVPGLEEYCRAETILNQIVWMGNGNLLTVVVLLTKALYLLYIEKADSAYDTMGRVVRLCFQLGLHNQSAWKDCSPFDMVMRQRIFRTVLYLERSLSFNCGAPFLVRETDFRVDMPKYYDDKSMFPGQPLPQECPELSYGPYLESASRFCRLCSEIWDGIFSVNAKEKNSQEFTVSMDARILYVGAQLPAHLQWNTPVEQPDQNSDRAHWTARQKLILYLRMNQLRMLLRQESMLSLKYSSSTATEVLAIAASTVNAAHQYYLSASWKPVDRLATILYLIGALLSLVCIIVKNDNPPQMRSAAIDSYKQGLNMLYEMAPNFSAARHCLQRIHRIIVTAKQAIRRFNLPESSTSEEMILDPDDLTTLMNKPSIIDPWLTMELDPFSQPYSVPTVGSFLNVEFQNFGALLDDIDSVWTDEDLFRYPVGVDAPKP